jgi:hypothetical protein
MPSPPNASLAHQVPQDHQVRAVHQADPDPRATLVQLEKMEALVQLAHLARPDPLAREDPTDHPAQLVLQPVDQLPLQETLDQPEKTDHRAPMVDPELQERMEDPAQPDPRDHPVPLVDPARTAALDPRAHPAQTETRVNPVSVPNTAPPTVVSSSRMAQGANHFLLDDMTL